ncbi:LCP family protein [Coprothermobacter platensis]|uniref:LCP family protein n=1 Tax=Coprothermobacter platensis TaxID=108819 RepID=UPI00036D3726|nr:LCP family protein [Coprothermobacter platensis]
MKKNNTKRIILLVILAVAVVLAGYVCVRYTSYEHGLKEAEEAYVIPKAEPETDTATAEENQPEKTTSTATSTHTASSDKIPAAVCNTRSTNILVLGIDTGEPYNRRPRSDTMMIYSLQPCKNRIVEVSIPRDSRVQIPGYMTTNINRAFEVGGAALSQQTVEQLFDIKIDRVVVLDFAGFTKLIDVLGGITVTIEPGFNEKYNVDPPLPVGKVTLNGAQALQYVRARKSDVERVQRQQAFISALYKQIKAKKAYLTVANFILEDPDVVVTNYSSGELLSLARNAEKYSNYKLQTIFLRGTATYIDGLSSWILNKEDVQNVHIMLSK